MFNESHTPQIHVHVGSEIWGSTRYTDLGEAESASARVTIPCHEELAEWLARDIIFDGIDANQSRGQFNPLGDPVGGVSHTLTDPLLTLLPRLDIPIVPVHLNAHVDPAITGHRLLVLGRIIGQSLEERTDRIAILASGGLSGHPRGYVAGWIDEKLDDWVLYWLRREDPSDSRRYGTRTPISSAARPERYERGWWQARQWRLQAPKQR